MEVGQEVLCQKEKTDHEEHETTHDAPMAVSVFGPEWLRRLWLRRNCRLLRVNWG
jgi:hypothetical protein